MSDLTTPERFAAGRDAMAKIYGAALLPAAVQAGASPFIDETVGHVFADIWLRPGLAIRDRRLLVLGATAMLGRADLIEVQAYGALANGELNQSELEEILLHLAFYAGWGNATVVQSAFRAAVTRFEAAGRQNEAG